MGCGSLVAASGCHWYHGSACNKASDVVGLMMGDAGRRREFRIEFRGEAEETQRVGDR